MALRTGGVTKDRVFKVYIRIPDGSNEDEVMDYIEDAVCKWKNVSVHWQKRMLATTLNPDTVCVKRRTPKYKEQD